MVIAERPSNHPHTAAPRVNKDLAVLLIESKRLRGNDLVGKELSL